MREPLPDGRRLRPCPAGGPCRGGAPLPPPLRGPVSAERPRRERSAVSDLPASERATPARSAGSPPGLAAGPRKGGTRRRAALRPAPAHPVRGVGAGRDAAPPSQRLRRAAAPLLPPPSRRALGVLPPLSAGEGATPLPERRRRRSVCRTEPPAAGPSRPRAPPSRFASPSSPSRPRRAGGRGKRGRPTPGLRVETGRAGAAPASGGRPPSARRVPAEGDGKRRRRRCRGRAAAARRAAVRRAAGVARRRLGARPRPPAAARSRRGAVGAGPRGGVRLPVARRSGASRRRARGVAVGAPRAARSRRTGGAAGRAAASVRRPDRARAPGPPPKRARRLPSPSAGGERGLPGPRRRSGRFLPFWPSSGVLVRSVEARPLRLAPVAPPLRRSFPSRPARGCEGRKRGPAGGAGGWGRPPRGAAPGERSRPSRARGAVPKDETTLSGGSLGSCVDEERS